jgi:hypothetical protein
MTNLVLRGSAGRQAEADARWGVPTGRRICRTIAVSLTEATAHHLVRAVERDRERDGPL